jgi:hypothetical protein
MIKVLLLLTLFPSLAFAGTGTRVHVSKAPPSDYCRWAAEGIAIRQVIRPLSKKSFQETIQLFENNPGLEKIPAEEADRYKRVVDRLKIEHAWSRSIALVHESELKNFLELGKEIHRGKVASWRSGISDQKTTSEASTQAERKKLSMILTRTLVLTLVGGVIAYEALPEMNEVSNTAFGACIGTLWSIGTSLWSRTSTPMTESSIDEDGADSELHIWLKRFMDSPAKTPIELVAEEKNIAILRLDGPDPEKPKVGAQFLFIARQ